MAYPIRKTAFTWDPDTESRGDVWDRIKVHVQRELDRIHAAAVLQRRLARRQAHPRHERNQQIALAAQRGVRVDALVRTHGLRAQRVREIIRAHRRWTRSYDTGYATLRGESPTGGRDLGDMPVATPQTQLEMRDP